MEALTYLVRYQRGFKNRRWMEITIQSEENLSPRMIQEELLTKVISKIIPKREQSTPQKVRILEYKLINKINE